MSDKSAKRMGSLSEQLWGWSFAIAILGIVIVTFTISDTHDLPMTIIGAVLGVAMTVFATFFLFKGQAKQQAAMLNQQREQEKDVEIFKQKLISYNAFLDSLRKYVTESNEITKKEVIFNAMAIRMHCSANIIDSIDENITAIIKDAGEDAEVRSLVWSLNKIACLFREELYGESYNADSKKLQEFEKAISGSTEEPTEEQKKTQTMEDEREDADIAAKTVPGWDEITNRLKEGGWHLENGKDSFKLTSSASPVVISVYRKKGKYIVEAAKEDDCDFSQTLKTSFKGARRYGTWWRELPISNYGVTEGSLLEQLPSNDRARASVIKWIDKLIKYI